MQTPANICPITIEIMFAINTGFLLVSAFEENTSRINSGINIAEQMHVTISNRYNGLNDETRILMISPGGLDGGMVTSVGSMYLGVNVILPEN